MDSGRFDVVEVPEDPSEEDMEMIGLPPRPYNFDTASMQLVPETSMQTLVLVAGADSRAQQVVERIAALIEVAPAARRSTETLVQIQQCITEWLFTESQVTNELLSTVGFPNEAAPPSAEDAPAPRGEEI